MHPVYLRRLALSLAAALLVCLSAADAAANAQRRRPPRQPAPRADSSDRTAPRVPSPQSVLGFRPGDDRKLADWAQIRDYFSRLDRASDRVLVRQLGETTLGKPLVVAYISDPENIRELDKYREIQSRLADPRKVSSEAERDRLVREGRTVVVISCSIHSTEIVASQMSMQLAYELASRQDEEAREILRNTILLLIPSANPDGIDIVADWYRRSLGKEWEGTEPPELYHHYAGHDDNRDWFMLNLKETRVLTRLLWKEWFPQLVYDVHQQGPNGSRFFAPPFYDPPNPHIAPLLLREVGLVGHKIAADLQAAGFRGVLTNAAYDTWWHGGFRTAPYYHNSVGILTEAASARLMTPTRVTREQLQRASTRGLPNALQSATNFPDPWPGGEWRPRDILEMELIASRSVLSMAAKYRERYLRNFYELGRRALDWPARDAAAPREGLRENGGVVAYLIPAGQGRDENVAKMLGALVEQGVEVFRMDRELHLTLAPTHGTVYNDARQAPPEWPLGSYLVFLRQPYRANVQALFERQVYPDRRTAGGEAERPYDVAGWTLPMQMGVQALPVASIREPASEWRLTAVKTEDDVRRDLSLPLAQGKPTAYVPFPNRSFPPNVHVGLYKSWTGSMDEGWTRYVFDSFDVPYTSLRDAEVRAGQLRAKYDVIVLPSMRLREIVEGRAKGTAPPEITGGIGDAGAANLKKFVEEGGTLVTWDDSTEFAIQRLGLPVRNVLEGLKTSEFYCPGSILRVDVEAGHPLARGLQPATDVYFVNGAAFEVTDGRRARVVARYAERREDVLRSGWLLGAQHIAGRAAAVEAELGRGRVVLYGFRPQHRAQTWGTFPFVFNALDRAGQ